MCDPCPAGCSLATALFSPAAVYFQACPLELGAFFSIQVTDAAANTTTMPFSITVTPALGIDNTVIGQPVPTYVEFFEGFFGTGGAPPYTISLASGSFPPGLTFSQNYQLSGMPTKAGVYNFVMRVMDSAGFTATGNFSIAVAQSLRITSPLTLSHGNHRCTLFASLECHWRCSLGLPGLPGGGTLPPGLAITSAGVVTGVPTAAGTYIFAAKVTDGGSEVDMQGFNLTISQGSAPPPALTIATPVTLGPGDPRRPVSANAYRDGRLPLPI